MMWCFRAICGDVKPLLKEVEILKIGTWNKYTFSQIDLDAIVQNFDGPVGINEDHGIAFYDCGQVVEIQRRGDTLVATLDVPDDIAKEVALGVFRGCSVELAEHDNRLVGLALGIDKKPAVVGLAPIRITQE